jgi:hypothetical protein
MARVAQRQGPRCGAGRWMAASMARSCGRRWRCDPHLPAAESCRDWTTYWLRAGRSAAGHGIVAGPANTTDQEHGPVYTRSRSDDPACGICHRTVCDGRRRGTGSCGAHVWGDVHGAGSSDWPCPSVVARKFVDRGCFVVGDPSETGERVLVRSRTSSAVRRSDLLLGDGGSPTNASRPTIEQRPLE